MIVITGAAGFIGSNLVARFNLLGRHDLILVDDLEKSDKWKNIRGLQFQQLISIADFIDFVEQDGLKNCEAIYHMGACSSTTETDMDFLLQNNFHYSQFLFRYATELDIPICYASSAATYGNGEFGYHDSHEQLARLRPLNKYGYSKHLMDQWVLRRSEKPTRWYGVKFFNVFGPNEYHKEGMRSLVVKAYEQIQRTGKVELFKSYRSEYSDGGQLRDFVYVQDVVDAMLGLMNPEMVHPNPGIYNIGMGVAHSFQQLVECVFKNLGLETQIKYIDMPEELKGQYQYFTQANMLKLKGEMPDFEFNSLQKSVDHYLNSFLKTDNWYLDLNKKELWP
jgi:ADP-L-glycero-D-manno-heptose 6-epimerase